MPTRLSALEINVSVTEQPCTRRSRARYLPENRLSVAKGTFLLIPGNAYRLLQSGRRSREQQTHDVGAGHEEHGRRRGVEERADAR